MSQFLMLGVVLDCTNVTTRNILKSGIVKLLKSVEHGDRLYIYREGYGSVPELPSANLSYLLPSKPVFDVNLGKVLEETVQILGAEVVEDYRRYIFVLSDRLDSTDLLNCQRSIDISHKSENLEAEFIFCDFSSRPFNIGEKLKNVEYWQFKSPSDFTDRIINFLKERKDEDGEGYVPNDGEQ